ncbi:MAG TPA: hypothetical protein VHG28_05745 [Longimicrobiaceae bacterium]|nr:hypothetical protein [Longimicrobiaceae bacterium]
MLRFIRDLIFPSAYDLRSRTRRPAATDPGLHGENAEPVSASQPESATATAAKG